MDGQLTIGGILVIPLIFGIVEASKEFGVTGKGLRLLTLLLGFGFYGLAQALAQGLIAEAAVPYITWIVFSIAGSLSAMGYYDFITKRVLVDRQNA